MQRKRALRRAPECEDIIWRRLKALAEQGWHFRKGASFRTFTLPFVEHAALLVVELEDAERNAVRDRLLREAGYTILRFPRADAARDPAAIVAVIRAVLEDRARSG